MLRLTAESGVQVYCLVTGRSLGSGAVKCPPDMSCLDVPAPFYVPDKAATFAAESLRGDMEAPAGNLSAAEKPGSFSLNPVLGTYLLWEDWQGAEGDRRSPSKKTPAQHLERDSRGQIVTTIHHGLCNTSSFMFSPRHATSVQENHPTRSTDVAPSHLAASFPTDPPHSRRLSGHVRPPRR